VVKSSMAFQDPTGPRRLISRDGLIKRFCLFPVIGWDIAVLERGPVLLEANSLFDTDLAVVPHGLTLSDKQLIPYFRYHWAKSMPRAQPKSWPTTFFRKLGDVNSDVIASNGTQSFCEFSPCSVSATM
jgi:hypothetical protein